MSYKLYLNPPLTRASQSSLNLKLSFTLPAALPLLILFAPPKAAKNFPGIYSSGTRALTIGVYHSGLSRSHLAQFCCVNSMTCAPMSPSHSSLLPTENTQLPLVRRILAEKVFLDALPS